MSITINKIGGASVSKKEEFLSLVSFLAERGEAPIFVVSAFKDVTDRLYRVLDYLHGILQVSGNFEVSDIQKAFTPALNLISDNLRQYFPHDANPAYRKRVDDFVASQMEILSAQLMTHQSLHKTLMPQVNTFRIRDLVIGFGENVSAYALQEVLELRGYAAKTLTDVACHRQFEATDTIAIHEVHESIQAGIAGAIESQVQDIREQILIIGGHIAGTPRGMTEDIGRSYSDVSAIDVAAALRRHLTPDKRYNPTVRFWKAEAGILSTDPRIFPAEQRSRVKKLDYMSQREGRELASTGNTLMHPQALALAHSENISRMELRNIEDTKASGTVYIESEFTTRRRFKCIACNDRLAMVTVEAGQMANIEGFMKGVSQCFADAGISLDTITTQGTSIDMTIILPRDKSQSERVMSDIVALEPRLRELKTGEHAYRTDRVTFRELARESISLIGSELRSRAALTMAEAIRVLDESNITVTSFVAAEEPYRVTLHVESGNGNRAVDILHRHFLENGTV